MNDLEAWGLATMLFGAGVLLLWLGNKQRTGTLRRNWLAGLRTHETLASDESWHAAHVATAGLVMASGVPQFVAAVAIVAWRPEEPALAVVVLGTMAVTVGLVIVAGVRGDRIAAQVNDERRARDAERG